MTKRSVGTANRNTSISFAALCASVLDLPRTRSSLSRTSIRRALDRRHLSSIRRWIGPLPDKTEFAHIAPPVVHVTDIEQGDFLFVCDSTRATELYLARVMSTHDTTAVVHCDGSGSKNQATATFEPI